MPSDVSNVFVDLMVCAFSHLLQWCAQSDDADSRAKDLLHGAL
jgi:hypothetical protein